MTKGSQASHLYIIVDNTKKTRVRRKAAFTKPGVNPMFKAGLVRKAPLSLPVTNRSRELFAKPRKVRAATKSLDDLVNRSKSLDVHTTLCPFNMDNVKSIINGSTSYGARTRVSLMGIGELSPAEAIALRLAAAREALGMKQAQIARKFDIGKTTWNAWETGTNTPSVLTMTLIADRYGISLDWIYRGRADTMAANLAEKVLAKYKELLQAREFDEAG